MEQNGNNYDPSEYRNLDNNNNNAAPQVHLDQSPQPQGYTSNQQGNQYQYGQNIPQLQQQPPQYVQYQQNPDPLFTVQISRPVVIQTGQIPVYPSTIVTNQRVPGVMLCNRFGLSPVSTTCTFCGSMVTTQVQETCNCEACCLCCMTGFLIYAIIQCCNGKDLCCCDAIHICPNCGRQLGTYYAR